MNTQLNLFPQRTGNQLAEVGMNLALNNAEAKESGWADAALNLFREFIPSRKQFMCEDFRKFCEVKGLTVPPSKRAFGGIILKAYKEGLIKKVGYGKVKNPRAHSANASVWEGNKKS